MHYSEDPVYAANGGDMGFIPQSALEEADVNLRRGSGQLAAGRAFFDHRERWRVSDSEVDRCRTGGQRPFKDPAVQNSIREVLATRKEQLLRSAYYEIERNSARIRNYLAEGVAGAQHGIN